MSAMGHSLQTHSAPAPFNVRYAFGSDQVAHEARCRLSARSGHSAPGSETGAQIFSFWFSNGASRASRGT
jgi:hypothetical protein